MLSKGNGHRSLGVATLTRGLMGFSLNLQMIPKERKRVAEMDSPIAEVSTS
jgi:hypothetical protein